MITAEEARGISTESRCQWSQAFVEKMLTIIDEKIKDSCSLGQFEAIIDVNDWPKNLSMYEYRDYKNSLVTFLADMGVYLFQ